MSGAQRVNLEYAPAPLRRQAWMKRSVQAAVLILLCAVGYKVYPFAKHRLELRSLLHQCLTYQDMSGGVLRNPSAGAPACWSSLFAALSPPGRTVRKTVFLHQMTARDGVPRLVAVDWTLEGSFNVTMIDPGSALAEPRVVFDQSFRCFWVDGGPDFVPLSLGQIDPADTSHFSIDISPGRSLDGWLREGDDVILETRRRPLASTGAAR